MPNKKVVGIIFPYILTPIPNLYDHSFPRYGQITFLTFRRPTTLTFDLKLWKYLTVTVYPYVICMQNTDKQTHTQTNTQTDMGITIPRPPPMGGEVIIKSLEETGTDYVVPWLDLIVASISSSSILLLQCLIII